MVQLYLFISIVKYEFTLNKLQSGLNESLIVLLDTNTFYVYIILFRCVPDKYKIMKFNGLKPLNFKNVHK